MHVQTLGDHGCGHKQHTAAACRHDAPRNVMTANA